MLNSDGAIRHFLAAIRSACLTVLRSVLGTYTTACTGSSEFISFIGQANNGVAHGMSLRSLLDKPSDRPS